MRLGKALATGIAEERPQRHDEPVSELEVPDSAEELTAEEAAGATAAR